MVFLLNVGLHTTGQEINGVDALINRKPPRRLGQMEFLVSYYKIAAQSWLTAWRSKTNKHNTTLEKAQHMNNLVMCPVAALIAFATLAHSLLPATVVYAHCMSNF